MGGDTAADRRRNVAQNPDRPAHVMFALQPLQHFLLGLLGSQPTDAFGQGGSGVARDDAQMTFQRSKGWLVVVASVLERFVQAALQLDGAEQGGDAATVEVLEFLRT